jgi:hypothetical protein
MEHDRAIDHAGRLHDFLGKSITELDPKMSNNLYANTRLFSEHIGLDTEVSKPVTVIQPNEFRPKDDDLITGLTGIGQLADRLISRIAAAKVRTEAANAKVEQAFVKLDSAAVVLERVAEKAEAEADAAIARIGQVSNMEPE